MAVAFGRAITGDRVWSVTRIQESSHNQIRYNIAWFQHRIILAENGGLDVELEPDGVLGIWNAGPCKLNRGDDPGPLWFEEW
jgi:hypothetical protein